MGSYTAYAGPLPSAWGSHGGFPALITLYVVATSLTGTVPAAWGRNGAFPFIVRLQLGSTGLAGSLPAEWVSKSGFQQLTHLLITNCSITGTLCARLAAVVHWGRCFTDFAQLACHCRHLCAWPTLPNVSKAKPMCAMFAVQARYHCLGQSLQPFQHYRPYNSR